MTDAKVLRPKGFLSKLYSEYPPAASTLTLLLLQEKFQFSIPRLPIKLPLILPPPSTLSVASRAKTKALIVPVLSKNTWVVGQVAPLAQPCFVEVPVVVVLPIIRSCLESQMARYLTAIAQSW